MSDNDYVNGMSKAIIQPQDWVEDEELSATKLSDMSRGIRSITNGIPFGRQINPGKQPSSSTVPLVARLVLTDTTAPVGSLAAIDGVTPTVGDYVLVFQGTQSDGMYRISAASWGRVAKLNSTDGTDQAPVYPQGTLISVYDGNSAPAVYMVKPGTLGGL